MAIPLVPQLLRVHLAELAQQGQRMDSRDQWESRDIVLQTNVLPNAEGSAMVTMGDTIVYAGVKFQIMTPYPDRPNQGGLMCSACLLYTSPSPRDLSTSRMPSSA